MPETSERFYHELPAMASFQSISDYQQYQAVPEDWLILIADVKGSTEAIANGQYKDVNMLGASVIIAILNMRRDLAMPFVFGGDGSTLVLPASLETSCRQQLPSLIALARRAFSLTLRIGLVPVSVVRKAGWDVRVAKFAASADYQQALLLISSIWLMPTAIWRGKHCSRPDRPRQQRSKSGGYGR